LHKKKLKNDKITWLYHAVYTIYMLDAVQALHRCRGRWYVAIIPHYCRFNSAMKKGTEQTPSIAVLHSFRCSCLALADSNLENYKQ